MKITLLLVCTLITFISSAQQRFPCDNSRVGKLITKPLVKNGKINYDIAINKLKKAEYNDGVFISGIDSMQQNNLYRIYHFRKDSAVMIEYTYDEQYESCNYFLSVSGHKGFLLYVRLSADGQIEPMEPDDNFVIDKKQQSLVDSLMNYLDTHN